MSLNAKVGRVPTVQIGQSPAHPEDCRNPHEGGLRKHSLLATVRPLTKSAEESLQAVVLCSTVGPRLWLPRTDGKRVTVATS